MKTILIKGVAFEADNGTMVNKHASNAQMGFTFSSHIEEKHMVT
jgi:hypothetical protein